MRLEKALVDQGFKDEVGIHGALLDVTGETIADLALLRGQAEGFGPVAFTPTSIGLPAQCPHVPKGLRFRRQDCSC